MSIQALTTEVDGLMETFRRLIRQSGTFICIAAMIGTLVVMLLNHHTRYIFRDDLSVYLWVISPYSAVGIISYLGRESLPISIFGFVTAILITLLSAFHLLPYLLEHSNNTGKAMAAGLMPLMQWQVVGVMIVIALVLLGPRRLYRGKKDR